jgi:predicted dienelactone hydrolase
MQRLISTILFLAGLIASAAQASVGLTELPGKPGDGPVTVFYPSSSEAKAIKRGPYNFTLAQGGMAVAGNRRLIVISHGSGGAPWPHADLAQRLVQAGFVVALPEHQGDNYKDFSKAGPESWKQRPAEVSRAIDVLAADARFSPLLKFDKVGLYGMSAGGHTALALAGGRWSPVTLRNHCAAHLEDDFYSCVGLATELKGDMFDSLKIATSRFIINWRLNDSQWNEAHDPRIAAIVANVPYSVDFDLQSLAKPRVPLGLVLAGQDIWLTSRFHGQAVQKTCAPACTLVAELPGASHGSMLSPSPPLDMLPPLLAKLMRDPPGFDRLEVPRVDQLTVDYFRSHLLP